MARFSWPENTQPVRPSVRRTSTFGGGPRLICWMTPSFPTIAESPLAKAFVPGPSGTRLPVSSSTRIPTARGLRAFLASFLVCFFLIVLGALCCSISAELRNAPTYAHTQGAKTASSVFCGWHSSELPAGEKSGEPGFLNDATTGSSSLCLLHLFIYSSLLGSTNILANDQILLSLMLIAGVKISQKRRICFAPRQLSPRSE